MIQIQSLWVSGSPDQKVKNFQYVKAITIEYLILFLENNTFTVNFRSLVDDSTQTITFDFFKDKSLSDIKLNELGTYFYLLTEDGLFVNVPIFLFSEESIGPSWEKLVKSDDPVKYLKGIQRKGEQKKNFSFASFGEYIFGKGEEQKTKKSLTYTVEDMTTINIKKLITEIHIYDYLNEDLSFSEKVDMSDKESIGSFETFEKWVNIYEEEYQVFMARGGYIVFLREDTSQIKVYRFPFEIALFKIIKSQKSSSMLLQNSEGISYLIMLERIAENRVDTLFEKYAYSIFDPRRMNELTKSSLYFDQANIREDTKFIQYQPEFNLIQIFSEGNAEKASENVQCFMEPPVHLIEWLQFFLAFYVYQDQLEIKLISKKILKNQIRQGLYKNGKSPSSRKTWSRVLKYLQPPFQDLESACIVSEKINFDDIVKNGPSNLKITGLKLDHSNLIRSQSQGSYDLSFILACPHSLSSITISLKQILDNNWKHLSQPTIDKDRFLVTDFALFDFYGDYLEKISNLKEELKQAKKHSILFDMQVYEMVAFKEKNLNINELKKLIITFLEHTDLELRANIIHLLLERMIIDHEITPNHIMEYTMLIFFAVFRGSIDSTYNEYFTLSFNESLSEELKRCLESIIASGDKPDTVGLSLRIIFRVLELAQEKCINVQKGYFNSYFDYETPEGESSNFQLYFEKKSLKYSMIESTVTPYRNFSLWLAKAIDAKYSYLGLRFKVLLKICEDDKKLLNWDKTITCLQKLDYEETLQVLYNSIFKAKILKKRSVHAFLSYLDRALECLLASRNISKKEIEDSLELFTFYYALGTKKKLQGDLIVPKKSLFERITKKLSSFTKSDDNERICDYVGVTYTLALTVHLHTLLSKDSKAEELLRLENSLKAFLNGMRSIIEFVDVEKILYFCLIEENESAASIIVSVVESFLL